MEGFYPMETGAAISECVTRLDNKSRPRSTAYNHSKDSMKTNARWTGCTLTIALLIGLACASPAQTAVRQAIRINPAAVSLIKTNRLRPTVTAAVANRMLEVKIPQNSTLLVRQGTNFVSAMTTRMEGTNKVYALRPTDVYVARGVALPPVALSTNAVRLPDSVHAIVDGQEISGEVDVALQSELMVFNPATQTYEGKLDICFRSPAKPEFAKHLVPLDLRLYTTAGLQLSTNAVTLGAVGNAGCRDVTIQCRSLRPGAKVTVKSDALGDREFLLNFEAAPFIERYKTALIILGGVCLGALGGLVRTWHPPRVKQPWKRVAEGGFCGLVLVLLGQFGVKQLFQIEGPVTTSVLLGLCGVLGYLGVRMFEHFAPKEATDDKKPDA
jgi:hypothetical protein